MRTASTIGNYLHGDSHKLQCCICGEIDLDKLLVQDIGITAGISGDCFSFCSKCWNSKNLGQNILKLVDHPNGMKIKEDCLNIKELTNEE